MSRALAIALTLAACTDGTAPCDGPAPGVPALVASTPTDRFDGGTLTVVDRETLEVCDGVVTATPDSVLRAVGDRIIQVDRLGQDRLSWLDPAAWGRPEREFSTGAGTNPHDVVSCGEGWLVSLYERDGLALFDDEGRTLRTIELSDLADADGIPEASDLVSLDEGRALVALQRLDRGDAFAPTSEGALAVVDCVRGEVETSWPAPPNVSLSQASDGTLLAFGEDGTLREVDRSTGPAAPWITLDRAPSSAARTSEGYAVVITRDADLWHRLSCVDPTGEVTPLRTTDAYLPDVKIDEDGMAWVAVRPGWRAAGDDIPDEPVVLSPPVGLWRVDPVECAVIDEIPTALGPYDLALY